MRVLGITLVLVLILPCAVGAETLKLDQRNSLEFQLPSARWTFSRQAPPRLVTQSVNDIERELRATGQHKDREAVLNLARKRLAQDEGFVFDSRTGACLVIDFSPLHPGEALPSDADIATSARYAGESLAGEKGVVGARPHMFKTRIPGARVAYRLEASYSLEGHTKHFTGIIGYFHPYWFFLYYTDPLKDPADAREMERLLGSVTLRRTIERK